MRTEWQYTISLLRELDTSCDILYGHTLYSHTIHGHALYDHTLYGHMVVPVQSAYLKYHFLVVLLYDSFCTLFVLLLHSQVF